MIGMNHSHAQTLSWVFTPLRDYTPLNSNTKDLSGRDSQHANYLLSSFSLRPTFPFPLKDNLPITSVLPPSHSSGPTQSGALTSALTGLFTTVVYTIISFSCSLTNLSLPLKSTFLSCPSWVSVPACLGIYQIIEEGGEGRKKHENFPSKEILISRLLLLGVKICIDY